MLWQRTNFRLILFCSIACLCLSKIAVATESRGQVIFNGLPVPGAVVTATQEGKKLTAVTNQQGNYSFADLSDGKWTISIAMTGFSRLTREITVAPNEAIPQWELKLLPLNQINAQVIPKASLTGEASAPKQQIAKTGSAPDKETKPEVSSPKEETASSDLSERAMNGLLINGSANNGAASPFAQAPAFGNKRNGAGGLYNGGIGMTFDNSTFDAKPFSITGLNTPKPAYNDLTGMATLGGPLRIPHLLHNGPNFFVGYQWTRNRNNTTDSVRVPDAAERSGDLSQLQNSSGQPVEVFDPQTGLPFPNNTIPSSRISSQARALLSLYPLPNFDGGTRYNYQIPLVTNTHQDALQSRFNKGINNRNQIYGAFAFQSTRTDTPNVFQFLDTSDLLGINTSINWWHRLTQHLFMNPGYQFSRLRMRVTPYFENRQNVSGNAGVQGNNQDPVNWGPPTLAFSSGITGLSDTQSSFNRNQTNAFSYSMFWSHGRHNITFGGDFRRQESNIFSQQDPRGSFAFTGAATGKAQNSNAASGSDFADFLLGIPDTSSIAFGNPDKYFRESGYDGYVTDDWRVRPEFTINAGMRWEYGAPITELYGRLVNLDIASGFSAAAPVLANNPTGPVTGQRYPDSLIRPDKNGFEPRVGIAWRPVSGSSLVIRAGYGIYYDTSVYQAIVKQMAQQAPLSKSLSVENSSACPLSLADGFHTCPSTTANTFAVDPNFRIGYAQNWQLSVQRDLPASLQLTATYLGIKGTRGMQEFLPNTYPVGAANPCPTCPIGFTYMTSNGNSTREAAQIQLRRRLHNGFAGLLQYTFSKSVDNDSSVGAAGASQAAQNAMPPTTQGNGSNPSTGASSQAPSQNTPAIAQDWLNLRAERGLSNFDQRHLLSMTLQYTSGMGVGGGTLLSGWRGKLFKEWTAFTQVTAGSGLPETPIYPAAVPGTGATGIIRPDYTGAPIHISSGGYFLNRNAYKAPVTGRWGNAGRNSITGPTQFSLNAALGRTFRVNDRYNLDFWLHSTNLLNHVTFADWNTTITSPQFGLPVEANQMRNIQTTLRLRF